MLFTITPYIFMFCFSINTPVCCMYFTSLNINLATYFSLTRSRLLKLLLGSTLDLWNSRHPARERRNLQVEANTSHDFGPDVSVRTPSLTQSYMCFDCRKRQLNWVEIWGIKGKNSYHMPLQNTAEQQIIRIKCNIHTNLGSYLGLLGTCVYNNYPVLYSPPRSLIGLRLDSAWTTRNPLRLLGFQADSE